MMKKVYVILSVLCLTFSFAFADSPLTSTDFHQAYSGEKILQKAGDANGVLTEKLADLLISRKGKIDVKMALINYLSWNLNGKKNALVFLNRLLEKGIYNNTEDFRKNGEADHLLCMAYLKALDNYFDVQEAFQWAELALQKNTKSYTFHIIHSLIHAQLLFDSDWCLVYQTTHSVRTNQNLKKDMKEQAVNIIFEYMDLYSSYCE
jgi:hypothetical protein